MFLTKCSWSLSAPERPGIVLSTQMPDKLASKRLLKIDYNLLPRWFSLLMNKIEFSTGGKYASKLICASPDYDTVSVGRRRLIVADTDCCSSKTILIPEISIPTYSKNRRFCCTRFARGLISGWCTFDTSLANNKALNMPAFNNLLYYTKQAIL